MVTLPSAKSVGSLVVGSAKASTPSLSSNSSVRAGPELASTLITVSLPGVAPAATVKFKLAKTCSSGPLMGVEVKLTNTTVPAVPVLGTKDQPALPTMKSPLVTESKVKTAGS